MTSQLKVLIVEDEPLAQDLIRKYISRIPDLVLSGVCENAIDSFTFIKNERPDIVFLDINMPEMTGMELLSALGIHKPAIIITTGYPDFAVDSYSFDVVDYLLKPIPFDRLLRSVEKVRERRALQTTLAAREETGFTYLKIGKANVKVRFDEIILVEGMKDYLKVHTADEVYVVHQTMKSMESLLPVSSFIRINRSFIIHIDSVRVVEGNQIDLVNKRKVDIGVTYRDAVFSRLQIVN